MAANFTAAAFDNAAVTAATNPSAFGHHHGPITNPNAGWVPPARIANPRVQITAAINGTAPVPPAVLSAVNTGVCDIDTGGGVMCGTVCGDQPSLRRHIRNAHPGAVNNPSRTNTTIAETTAGTNAIKLFVRSQGWRRAQYLREPGRGPANGLVDQYATAMEAIAQSDAAFAARFGTRFHRATKHEIEHMESISDASITPIADNNQDPPQTPPPPAQHMPNPETPPAPAQHMPNPETPTPPTPHMPNPLPPRRSQRISSAHAEHMPSYISKSSRASSHPGFRHQAQAPAPCQRRPG